MTKEELKEAKGKLLKLKEQQKKGLTGYPHIDKPWEKFYEDKSDFPVNEKTVYQEVHDNNIGYPKDLAIQYFGSNITFRKLDKNINSAAKSLKEYGVKKGDFVTIVSAGIPETVYAFYGLSKIGATANLMAFYFDHDQMIKRIDECDSDILIVMSDFYPYIKDAIKKSKIKNVVIIPTLNSSMLKFIKPDKIKTQGGEVTWKQFIKDGSHREETETVNLEKDKPLAMVYSSGTTGASKGILLSEQSFQNLIASYRKSGMDVSRGHKMYQIIPPWFSTGISTSIHLPLSSGATVLMDPRFERDIFVKNIFKYKPDYTVAATSMYEGFLDEKLVGNKDLSFFTYPTEGGEPLRKEVQEKIEDVFKKHNGPKRLLVGYGQCECGATISTETLNTIHTQGTVGIPLPDVNIAIVDENMNPLKYNERGQIIVDTKNGMLEYYNNPEETNKYFYKDSNNTKWYCTGDIGKINENGNLFVYGRASDYTEINDKKVYNFDIENAVLKDSNVKLVEVQTNNNLLTCHVVFTDEFMKICNEETITQELKNIQDLIYEDIQDVDFVPSQFKVRKNFPYAKSGKRDINEIKNEMDGFIQIGKYQKSNKKLIKKYR